MISNANENSTQNFRLILASGSPRRRELLAQMGYTFEIQVPNVDENVTGHARDVVAILSRRKAARSAPQRCGLRLSRRTVGAPRAAPADAKKTAPASLFGPRRPLGFPGTEKPRQTPADAPSASSRHSVSEQASR